MKEDMILAAVKQLQENYKNVELFHPRNGRTLPIRSEVIEIVKELRPVLFPGYFAMDTSIYVFPEYYAGYRLNSIYDRLKKQIQIALAYRGDEDVPERAAAITERFISRLPQIQDMLLKDVQAGFDGDPAAKSREEIIFSYPGFLAIYVYRLAHVLYLDNVPFIPRIMTEYAHSNTGIDINPGATIGEYFFIDHGTGVVIGETTEIGNYVKLYQGVTLGALSTRKGQQLSGKKRHPTIQDNVTIYSNSSVLGGDTVIGENTIIGGNTFITESIPANSRVTGRAPELVIQNPDLKAKEPVWFWEI